jgi:predicted esterase
MLKEVHIEFSQKRRYYTNELKVKSKILVALHGYGQLAQFFARKFAAFDQSFGIIAPEGPHRFYLEGSSGRVGASWMTKEWREQDIEENTDYLLALIEKVKAENTAARIYLLGFSQGGATAARLYQSCPDLFEKLILWASVFPPDVSVQDFEKAGNLHFAIGNLDPYFLEAQKGEVLQTYRNLGFKIHEFEGKHDIDPTTLSKIL